MSTVLRTLVACGLAAVCVSIVGCVASHPQPELTIASPGEAAVPDVQQLAGHIVAGVQAELTSRIETAVETTLRAEVQATGIGGNATGYNSEFGVGATLVVTLTLILALILSHRREVLRIKQNGRHTTAPTCSGKHTP